MTDAPNIVLIYADDGDVDERYSYDPYGKVAVRDGDWSLDDNNASDWANEILYCGYRLDPATGADGQGLYHVRHRPYLPPLGRWMVRDPKDQDTPGGGYHDGMGLYEYVGSAVPHRVDPTGLYYETTRSKLRRELRDLERRKDHDWRMNEGRPGPDSDYLWGRIGEVKQRLATYQQLDELRRRKDYDYAQHAGRPGAHTQFLVDRITALHAGVPDECECGTCAEWFITVEVVAGGGDKAAGLFVRTQLEPSKYCEGLGWTSKEYDFIGAGAGVGAKVSFAVDTTREKHRIVTQCIGWSDWQGFGRATSAGAAISKGYSMLFLDMPHGYLEISGVTHGFELDIVTTVGFWTVPPWEELE